MISVQKIEELLIKQDDIPEDKRVEHEKITRETMGNLSRNFVLMKLLDVSMYSNLVEALKLLSDRKFEEAFAALQSFSAIEDIESQLKNAQVEPESVTSTNYAIRP